MNADDLKQLTTDALARTALLRDAILSKNIAVEESFDLGGALGTSSGGRIQLLKGLAPAEEFVVLVHEFAHELLHRSADRPASQDARELEAEAVAFVVGDAVGLDVSQASRDYIHLYRGDREALASSLPAATAVASGLTTSRCGTRLGGRRPAVTAPVHSRGGCSAAPMAPFRECSRGRRFLLLWLVVDSCAGELEARIRLRSREELSAASRGHARGSSQLS